MGWTDKYWDIIENIYWTPPYIGLESISQSHIRDDGETIRIPKSMTNPTGPLYRRVRDAENSRAHFHRKEEMINQIFDLTFGVASGNVVSDLLGSLAGLSEPEAFTSLGREVRSRYRLDKHRNVTQHDGFFIGQKTNLAVELKFDAKTSPDQLAKYCYLLLSEERYSQKKLAPHLLYIMGKNPRAALSKQLGLNPDGIGSKHSQFLMDSVKSGNLRKLLENNRDGFKDILDRVSITGCTWADLVKRIDIYVSGLNDSDGDKTLANLLVGFSAEVRKHPLSNI